MTTTIATLERPLGIERTTERRPRRLSPILLIGLGLIGLVVLTALAAPLIAAHDPTAISGDALGRPSAQHWLGTDVPGRDIFAQVVYGARTSVLVAVFGSSLAMLGAILLGVVPTLLGGRTDAAANRFVIFLLAVPGAPLLILIGSLAVDKGLAVIVVIGFVGAPPNARILRAQALSLRERGFIAASRGFGAGPLYVLRRHVVPGLAPLLVVGLVTWAGAAVGLEAGLAFLGLGDPSSISWGLMMDRALSQQGIYFSSMWTWWVLPPGLAITVTLLGFTFTGVGLEPIFNPRTRRTR